MPKLLKIAKMEFRRTAMNKVFAILTISGPLLICSIAILPGLLASSGAFRDGETSKIAVVGADAEMLAAMEAGLISEGISIVGGHGSPDSLRAGMVSGDIDGYLEIPVYPYVEPVEFVSKDATDLRIRDILASYVGKALMARKFANAGIPRNEADGIIRPVAFEVSHLDGNGTMVESTSFMTVFTSSLIFASLLYLTIVFYGQAVGRSVLAEKTNKTVEILLSSVRPADILFGKILGNAVASLLQYGIWIVSSMALLKAVGPRFGLLPGISLPPEIYLYLVLFFILAYFLYCSIYAALGAACRDEQQLAQLSFPVIILLIIPIILLGSIIASPRAPVVIALSFFPLTAPIVMFIRILLGGANGAEISISVILLATTIIGCTVLSANIFKSCILLDGKTGNSDLILLMLRGREPDGKSKR